MEKQDNLLQWTRERFQWTEDAFVVLEPHFGTPTHEGRTIGDEFRYLTVASRIMPERIRALRETGELPFPGNEEIAEAVAKFASFDCEMLRTELDAAHRDAWMDIRCFSNEDSRQTFTIRGKEHTLGTVIRSLVLREKVRVNKALEAAGIPKWDLSSIGGPSVNHRYWGNRYFELRATADTKRFRHPDFEMFANGKRFGTLAYVSGNWLLAQFPHPPATYPSRAEAWAAARRTYPICATCGETEPSPPRRHGNRLDTICRRCWRSPQHRRRAFRNMRNSRPWLTRARLEAQDEAIMATRTTHYGAIEAAEAAGDADALEHLTRALPHIEAAARSLVR